MKFDDSFFEGEVKENFYIRPIMKCAWAAQLEVLEEIDRICKRHNITYFADWGTLLGAVRHQGFIPWDDDIDIAMKRQDYKKFLYYAKRELPSDWMLLNPFSEMEFFNLLTRVTNGTAVKTGTEFFKRFHGCPYVVGIDIFPLDYVPRDQGYREIQKQLLLATGLLAKEWRLEGGEESKWEALRELEKLSGVQLNQDDSISRQLYQLTDYLCAMFGEEDGVEITLMPLFVSDLCKAVPSTCYDFYVEAPFEHLTIPIPIGYDQVLRSYYGDDYMKPVRGTQGHDYPFFKDQEKKLREEYRRRGEEMPGWMR